MLFNPQRPHCSYVSDIHQPKPLFWLQSFCPAVWLGMFRSWVSSLCLCFSMHTFKESWRGWGRDWRFLLFLLLQRSDCTSGQHSPLNNLMCTKRSSKWRGGNNKTLGQHDLRFSSCIFLLRCYNTVRWVVLFKGKWGSEKRVQSHNWKSDPALKNHLEDHTSKKAGWNSRILWGLSAFLGPFPLWEPNLTTLSLSLLTQRGTHLCWNL